MSQTNLSDYRCDIRRPEDFDAFWDDLLAEAAAVSLRPEIEPVPLRSTEKVEVFAVHYDSIDGVRVFGWYCLPRGRRGPLPALLSVPGYIADPPLPKGWAARGYAVLSVAPRGKLGSNRQFNPGYPGLLTHNVVDRNTYGYRGFYIDAVRGIDFLLAQPDVDGSAVGVFGSSQGGALSIVAAALRKEIKAASVGAPYLCGILDAVELTSSYPYHEIRDYLRLYPERREAVAETLAYFDGLNFAPRIGCPLLMNIGLQDNVCPPETGFDLFRAIASEQKKLCTYDRAGHDGGKRLHEPLIADFFEEHLRNAHQ